VPSKSLLAAAARGESFAEAMAGVHRAVEAIAATEDDAALRRDGVDVVHGRGIFRSPTLPRRRRPARPLVPLRGGDRCQARGAAHRRPRDADPLTNEDLFQLPARPARLGILGCGSVGVEMGRPSRGSAPR
jgi:pyruvate/2-oxoglutarate dehydrogenase complex dihydrolipoamide dehydrogenase (E3) component